MQLQLAGAISHPGAAALNYLHYQDTGGKVKSVTLWVIADASTQRGRRLLAAALQYLSPLEDDDTEPSSCRIALLLSAATASAAQESPATTAHSSSMAVLPPTSVLELAMVSAQQAC